MSSKKARIRTKVATFLYHDVTDDPRNSGFQRQAAFPYKHKYAEFVENLDAIASSLCTPTLVHNITFYERGRYIVLTFDDGGKSALRVSEELARRSWPGHFFITTSRIGSRTFLSAQEIREIHGNGHIIGSHSHTHPDIFRAQSFEKMTEEWQVSCDVLSQLIGIPCDTASVPGGDISQNVFYAANQVGIRYLFTSEPRLTPQKVGECWILGRVCPKATTPVSHVRAWANFQQWKRALIVRNFKQLAKCLLFPAYKFYVQTVTIEES